MADGKGISKEEIKHIAWLARIELTRKEEESFRRQLNEILAYFKKLDEVDTKGVPPTYHVLDLLDVYRLDEVQPSLADKVMSCVPQRKARFVKAPRMM